MGKRLAAFAALIVIIVAAAQSAKTDKTAAAEPLPACRTDWQKCADNAELARNYRYWPMGACKRAANNTAKYGTPVWPPLAFGRFQTGTDYVSTGIVTAIEPDAQFSNRFGAMVHVQVTCTYDLRNKTVTNLKVSEH